MSEQETIFGKNDFVDTFKSRSEGYRKNEIATIYDVAMSILKEAADEGKRVRIPGVGTLVKKEYAAYDGKDFGGSPIQVPARTNYKLISKRKDITE